jgi:hypothetical protein
MSESAPLAESSRLGSGSWPIRRPEDGKLINGTAVGGGGLLLEDAGSRIGNPFSLFNLVRFPNTECITDTGGGGGGSFGAIFKYQQKKTTMLHVKYSIKC